jgi:hypothetical protein
MSDLSPTFADRIATWLFRPAVTAPTRPTAIFLGLFVGSGEVPTSGTGYARVELEDADLSGPSAGNGTVTVTAAVTFGSPTALWGDVDGAALFDQAGTRITDVVPLDDTYPVDDGDPAPGFAAGQISFTVA